MFKPLKSEVRNTGSHAGRGISHAWGSECQGVGLMSACLPVTAVTSLTEYSTNGMH